MDDEEPAVKAAAEPGTRYCRARPLRHRGATRTARVTVRHVAGSRRAITLAVRRAQPAIDASLKPRHRGLVATTVALLVLVSGLAVSFVAGRRPIPAACAAHSPIRVAADGHWLGIRADPPVAGTMLVHLCVGGTADPVSHWAIGTDHPSGGTTDSGRTPDAVLAVARQEALAALAATTDIGRVSVTVQTSSGKVLRFGTAV